MENKYYTPSIEEFHVGFEYEELVGTESNGKQDWSEKIFEGKELLVHTTLTEWQTFNNLKDSIDEGFIRVKYLDKEDIESFGFIKQDKIDAYGYDVYIKTVYAFGGSVVPEGSSGNKLTIQHNPRTNYICFTRESFGSWGNEKDTLPFSIKNKSELKKLITWLNIIPRS